MSAPGLVLFTAFTVLVVTVLYTTFRRCDVPTAELEPDQPEDPRAPSEEERVLAHREQMFRDVLAFNEWQAVSLAEAAVDWHEAQSLIVAGCSHELAVDILLP